MPLNFDPKTANRVFDIKTPGMYRCNVFKYNSGLSKLYIRVFKSVNSAPSFYIFFCDVGYFEGPMNWTSADFQVRPADECLDLMQAVGLVEDFRLDDEEIKKALAEAAHLYTVKTTHTTIRIIAGDAVMMTEIPDEIS